MTPAPGYVYDVFDATSRIIYVGSTADVFARVEQHYRESWWADQLVRVHARVLPAGEVRRAEVERIRLVRPRWNLRGLPPRREWTADQYVDWLISQERRVAFENVRRADPLPRRGTHRHVDTVRREFTRRFGYDPPTVLVPVAAA